MTGASTLYDILLDVFCRSVKYVTGETGSSSSIKSLDLTDFMSEVRPVLFLMFGLGSMSKNSSKVYSFNIPFNPLLLPSSLVMLELCP